MLKWHLLKLLRVKIPNLIKMCLPPKACVVINRETLEVFLLKKKELRLEAVKQDKKTNV